MRILLKCRFWFSAPVVWGSAGGGWGSAFLAKSWVGAVDAAKFSRLCAHQRGNSSALTCTECSLSAHCLEMDEGISRQGGNYFHSQKQGLGNVIAQGDRKVWRGSSCCLWLRRWSGKRLNLRHWTKASGEPATFPRPDSKFVLVECGCLSFSPRPVASDCSSHENISLCIPGKIGSTFRQYNLHGQHLLSR